MPRLTTIARTAATTALLVAAAVGPAAAHTSMDKSQVPAGTQVDLQFRAPGEKPPATNTSLDVRVPAPFQALACAAPLGWSCAIDATSAAPAAIVSWTSSGPTTPADILFDLTVRTPGEDAQGLYFFPAVQGYSDGSEAKWINTTGDDHPAPRLQVGASDTPVEENSQAPVSHEEESEPEPAASSEPEAEPAPSATAVAPASSPAPTRTTVPAAAAPATSATPAASEPAAGAGSSDAAADDTTSTEDTATADTDVDGADSDATGTDTTDTDDTDALTVAASATDEDGGLPIVPVVGLPAVGGGAAWAVRRRAGAPAAQD